MHDAAINGDYEALEFLIDNSADINIVADNGWTPLHAAASAFVGNHHKKDCTPEYSKYDVFKVVIDARPKINVKDNDGLTPLHIAVMNAFTGYRQIEAHSIDRINDLLAAGEYVNSKDKNGRTPLHWACMQGYTHFSDEKMIVEADVVNVLLQHGADKNIKDDSGKTAYDYAEYMGFKEIIKAFSGNENISENPKEEADKMYGKELIMAAWKGDMKEVKRLLKLGADIEYMDTDGFKAIDRARDNGFDDIVKLIEEY
jgi:uncharacterized protein